MSSIDRELPPEDEPTILEWLRSLFSKERICLPAADAGVPPAGEAQGVALPDSRLAGEDSALHVQKSADSASRIDQDSLSSGLRALLRGLWLQVRHQPWRPLLFVLSVLLVGWVLWRIPRMAFDGWYGGAGSSD